MTPEAYESLLDAIYTAAEDYTQWDGALSSLVDGLGAVGGALHSGTRDGSAFSFGPSFRIDPECQAVYAQHYYSVNPLNSALSRVSVGVAAPDHRLVPPREMERTEMHNDYMRRFGICGSITLILERNKYHEACLGVVRSLRSEVFSDEQVALVQRLAPHLQRAIALNWRFFALEEKGKTLEAAVERMATAVLLIDRSGLIRYSNAAGEGVLEKCDGLKVVQGRLAADHSSAQDRLSGLMRAALADKGARGASTYLPRRSSVRPLLIKIMPVRQDNDFWVSSCQARAMVFISHPDAEQADAAAEAMNAYGLTPAEKRLLKALIGGCSLREAAEIVGITRATSRNRLARIMAKTDTHRQSELIQLILRSTFPVH